MDARDGYMLLPQLSGLKLGSDRILVLFGFLSKLESWEFYHTVGFMRSPSRFSQGPLNYFRWFLKGWLHLQDVSFWKSDSHTLAIRRHTDDGDLKILDAFRPKAPKRYSTLSTIKICNRMRWASKCLSICSGPAWLTMQKILTGPADEKNSFSFSRTVTRKPSLINWEYTIRWLL